MNRKTYAVAVTGASGTVYAIRLAQALLADNHDVHLVTSEAARQVALREIGTDFPTSTDSNDTWRQFITDGLDRPPANKWGFTKLNFEERGRLSVYGQRDFSAGIASGSFLTSGMIICPCSMGTLSSIAGGASSNLIQRAADVHLKERRPLILVPRETPLGLIALQNMTRLTEAGATILPSMPGFYQNPTTISDLVDFVVARICDHLGVQHELVPRWGKG